MLQFKKNGFVRREELDFSDDGTRFAVYTVEGTKVTYARADGMVYIHVNFTYDYALSRLNKEYAFLVMKAIKFANKFNGVYDDNIDLELFREDIIYYCEELKNFKCEKPVIYHNQLDDKYYAFVYTKHIFDTIQCSFERINFQFLDNDVEIKELGVLCK